MANDRKYHLEDSRRPLGASLCGHVSYFALSIVSKAQWDLLEDDEKCNHCVGRQNTGFVPIRLLARGAKNLPR